MEHRSFSSLPHGAKRARTLRANFASGCGFGGVARAVKGGGQELGVAEGGKGFICLERENLANRGTSPREMYNICIYM